MFPSGGIERSTRPFGSPEEGPWHRFVARLALGSGADVQPMLVAGHNGRLFHAASHLGDTLRQSLCLRELCRRLDSVVDVAVGTPIAASILGALTGDAIVEHLRSSNLALGADLSLGPRCGRRPCRIRRA